MCSKNADLTFCYNLTTVYEIFLATCAIRTFKDSAALISEATKKAFIYQYSETNVMHFLFNLLRIKGLYMFRALLAHPQDSLHKRPSVYFVCVMSVGCTSDLTRTQYTKWCL
jgi:hypothetical protein